WQGSRPGNVSRGRTNNFEQTLQGKSARLFSAGRFFASLLPLTEFFQRGFSKAFFFEVDFAADPFLECRLSLGPLLHPFVNLTQVILEYGVVGLLRHSELQLISRKNVASHLVLNPSESIGTRRFVRHGASGRLGIVQSGLKILPLFAKHVGQVIRGNEGVRVDFQSSFKTVPGSDLITLGLENHAPNGVR